MKKQINKVSKTVALNPQEKKTTAVPAKPEAKKTPAEKKAPAAKSTKTPAAKAIPAKKSVPVKAVAKKAAPAAKTPVKKTAPAAKAPVKKAAPAAKASAKKTGAKKEETVKKLKLSKADKKLFHDLLMHARASFGEQIQVHVDEALSTRKDSAGERAGMATHMADLGSDNFRHDFELGLLTDEVDVLEMIDEALQRLEVSEYGICLDCGTIIPKERLEAKPYARYCTKCKSLRESAEDSRYHR